MQPHAPMLLHAALLPPERTGTGVTRLRGRGPGRQGTRDCPTALGQAPQRDRKKSHSGGTDERLLPLTGVSRQRLRICQARVGQVFARGRHQSI